MGNFIKQQEEKKEVKEKDKTRRERLAGYFFDLSMIIRFYVYKISVLPSIRYWWKASGIPQMDRRLASATSYW